jgi:hypothetical protein
MRVTVFFFIKKTITTKFTLLGQKALIIFKKWPKTSKLSPKKKHNTQNKPKKPNFLQTRLPVRLTGYQPVTDSYYITGT